MKVVFETLSLDEIADSGLYTLRPFQDEVVIPDDLAASFMLSDILSPPILLKTTLGNYDVICGRKRLKAVATIFKDIYCYCRVLPQDTSTATILGIMVEDQFTQGGVKIMEQAGYIALCHTLLPDKHARQRFLAALPPGRITKGTHFLLSLNRLAPRIQEKIHSGILSEKIVTSLSNLPESDQFLLFDLVEQLQIGSNNQKKLCDRLIDLTRRNTISLTELLEEPRLQAILSNSRLQPGRKGSAFLEELYTMTHPRLSKAEESFEDTVKKLALPPNWSIAPSRSFETDEVFLTIRYSNFDEFEKKGKPMIEEMQQKNTDASSAQKET
ncbi:MAG: hypothetical protein V2I36_00030 [Desulfopila sp.]|jgi:hypothetical protein|nr:hypothetical protein [Desulfopila sp.]